MKLDKAAASLLSSLRVPSGAVSVVVIRGELYVLVDPGFRHLFSIIPKTYRGITVNAEVRQQAVAQNS